MAAVDDYIQAFLQVVAYYQYLKGGIGGMGPSKEELKLRCAQRRAQCIGDLGVLQSALLGMLGVDEFCTHDPHHKEQRSLVLKSGSLTHPLELMKKLIGLIPFIFLGHYYLRGSLRLVQQPYQL